MKTFQPWTIDGSALRLTEWPDHGPGAVLVEVDVFEELYGPVLNTGHGKLYSAIDGEDEVLRDLFRHIDTHPETHFILRTRHPERLRECWPGVDVIGDVAACSGNGEGWSVSRIPKQRHSTTLQIGPLHTQADADRLLPAGLECSDLVGSVEVYCQPAERIQFPLPCRESVSWAAVSRITVSGGDKPLHPDWVRCLRDQAVAAGVPFALESWGDYGPVCSKRTGSVVVYSDGRWCDFTREAIIAEERRSGKDHDRCSPHTMFRVGRENSGNTLDGRTWPRVPTESEEANG